MMTGADLVLYGVIGGLLVAGGIIMALVGRKGKD